MHACMLLVCVPDVCCLYSFAACGCNSGSTLSLGGKQGLNVGALVSASWFGGVGKVGANRLHVSTLTAVFALVG